jgi:hypothetical protein
MHLTLFSYGGMTESAALDPKSTNIGSVGHISGKTLHMPKRQEARGSEMVKQLIMSSFQALDIQDRDYEYEGYSSTANLHQIYMRGRTALARHVFVERRSAQIHSTRQDMRIQCQSPFFPIRPQIAGLSIYPGTAVMLYGVDSFSAMQIASRLGNEG